MQPHRALDINIQANNRFTSIKGGKVNNSIVKIMKQ